MWVGLLDHVSVFSLKTWILLNDFCTRSVLARILIEIVLDVVHMATDIISLLIALHDLLVYVINASMLISMHLVDLCVLLHNIVFIILLLNIAFLKIFFLMIRSIRELILKLWCLIISHNKIIKFILELLQLVVIKFRIVG